MASLGMEGPFNLTKDEIDKRVTKMSPGNYGLGRVLNKTFYVSYVGRADIDVNKRLKSWVEEYKNFKFSFATSPKAAFEKECHNYHDFGESQELDNDKHPQRPDNTNWKCPICDIFD